MSALIWYLTLSLSPPPNFSFILTSTDALHGIPIFPFQDIRAADLVISHAGAGSILESLEAQKPLLVVINDTLMDNHQTELASKMRELGHCLCASVDTLEGAIAMHDSATLTPYPRATPRRFGALVDAVMAS